MYDKTHNTTACPKMQEIGSHWVIFLPIVFFQGSGWFVDVNNSSFHCQGAEGLFGEKQGWLDLGKKKLKKYKKKTVFPMSTNTFSVL